MDKNAIAAVLSEIALLLELKGENPFKFRAYQSGARVLESLDEDLAEIIAESRLTSIKGIGKALALKIETLHQTGQLEYYDNLVASVPPGLVEMLEIPGLGPKKIKAVHEALGADTIEKLQAACDSGQVAALPGFGEKSQVKIIAGMKNREAYGKRHLWWNAFAAAEPILEGLKSLPQVERAEHAGSLRRRMETVGDLDFLVASTDPQPVMDWFTAQPSVSEVSAHGETKSSVRLKDGLQADLRVVPPKQFVFALHHFTGSKDHNVRMRQRALQRGFSMTEWGLRPESGSEDLLEVNIESETDLFRFLQLDFIPPELREDLGEIEAAESGRIPDLIEATDIKGVFHNHTTASDGHNTLEEMATEAQMLGWEYLGIADHSKASFQAKGFSEDRLLKQVEEIRRINESGKFTTRLLTGTECDILPSGELDFSDSVLARVDYVVVSVHSSFSQSEEEMTARIIKALENPHATMLGHLTGRILLRREPYKVNRQKVIDAAVDNGNIIELNANPSRLDMDWRLWRSAAEKGLLCAINPDAHTTEGLHYYLAGVNAARKGWLTSEHILNTKPLGEVLEYFSI